MPTLQYPVRLSAIEQSQLQEILSKGISNARAIRRAHILLLADENRARGRLHNKEIA